MRSGAWWPSEAPPPPALRPGGGDHLDGANDDGDDVDDDGVDDGNGDDDDGGDDNGGGTISFETYREAPSINFIHTTIKTWVKQQKQIYNNKNICKTIKTNIQQ